MGKGLPRSTARGNPQITDLSKVRVAQVPLTGTVNVTGVADAVDAGEIVLSPDLPEGNILFLGAVANLTVDVTDADMIADWAGDFSIGTVPNSNDVDVGDAGEADIIPSTQLAADSGVKVTLPTRGASTAALSGVIFDNTDGSLELNLNLLFDDNQITDAAVATVTTSGMMYIAYILLGDD